MSAPTQPAAHLTDRFHPAAELFLPQGAVGVQQDLDRLGIVERGEEHRSKVPAQFF
jgi:hypothetical protein